MSHQSPVTALVHIIGVAPEGDCSLSPAARLLVDQAEMVFGGERLLQMFPSLAGEKLAITNNLADAAGWIEANLGVKRMVVLASGDPGFFGIARYLTARLGKEAIDIIPNVSAMQVAFARIKESWDDAVLVSVHSRPIEAIVEAVRPFRKIGIFTDEVNTPGKVARILREHGFEDCRVYVCQDVGSGGERIVSTHLGRLDGTEFSPLNVMVLVRDENVKEVPAPLLLGIPDDSFLRREGRALITKLEVRAVSLAAMRLTEHSTVWDIGAGSGAVSIEASLLAGKGRVFAIEKNPEDIAIIRRNIQRFRRHNIQVIQAFAPEKLDGLPDPAAVFIGGSGGNMTAILDCVCRRLVPCGRVVINVATLQNLHHAVSGLEANGFTPDTALVNIARSKGISNLTRLEALNPVFVVAGNREEGSY